MADTTLLDDGVLLTQEEVDKARDLKETINKPIEKPFERPKNISILAANAKWTEDIIGKFNSGEEIILEEAENIPVRVLSDGRFLANAILNCKDGKKTVKLLK